MATLVVEDGTGLPDANCYSSMEDSDAYHDSVGHTAWVEAVSSPPDDVRVQAKIRGAAYIDRYPSQVNRTWPGSRVNGRDQAMAWPRENAVDQEGEEIDDESVPNEVIIASYEAEWREFQDPGSLTPDVITAQQVLSERVGSIAVTYSNTAGVQAQIPVITEIENILSSILGRSRGTRNSNVSRM